MDTTEIEATIQKIGPLAATVAAQHEEHQAARKREAAAEATLLERVVATVKPALRALCSRVQTASSSGNNPLKGGEDSKAWRDGPALYLGDDKPGPTHRGKRDDHGGSYVGTDLFLGADGSFFSLEYEGTWSRWENSRCEWTATETPLTVAEALDEENLEQIVGRLNAVLAQHAAGNLPKRTKAAEERTAKLSAVAALLK